VALDLRRGERRQAVHRLAGMAVGFLLPNLPFLVDAPGAWLHSLLLPMSLPMFPLGVGLIAPSVDLGVPTLPAPVYAALELGALAGLVWAFGRRRSRLPAELALVVFALPFLLAWRSLDNYVAFLPIVALAAWRAQVVRYGVTDGPLTMAPTSFERPTKNSSSMQAMPIAETRS
jgi:uncharacterized membrane protein